MVSISIPALTIGAAVLGAGATVYAASETAGAEKSAAKTAANTQLSMYNQTRSDLLPYMQQGQNAFSTLGNMMGMGGPTASANMLAGLQQYPGYQFALQQGQQGLDRTAASRGLLLSGGQLKDSMSYNQGMANQLYGTYYNQMMQASQLGENAAAMTGQAGTTAAAGAAQAQQSGGNLAASTMGNSIMGAANNLFGQNSALSNYLMSQSGYQGASLGNGTYYNGPAIGDISVTGTYGDITSDRRAKTAIKRIGTLDSGLPVYNFRYKGSSLPQIGVMADEVKKLDPGAVRRDPRSGYDMVNYGKVARLPPSKSYLPKLKEVA